MKREFAAPAVLIVLAFAQVTAFAQPIVQISRPNASDRFTPGATFRIQWYAMNVLHGDWNVYLHTNNTLRRLSVTAVHDGGGNWHADYAVAGEPPGCGYTLVIHEDVTEADGTSEPFCLEASQLRISSTALSGNVSLAGTFTNGIAIVRRAENVNGPWPAIANVFTTSSMAHVAVTVTGATTFLRAEAVEVTPTRSGFTNLIRAYGLLSTIAGAGGPQDVNNWRPEYEGGPATAAVLSGPHMAMADRAGFIYIADKDAHAIRKIRHDGTLVTVAGTSTPGNAPDTPVVATEGALNQPNGLWVRGDGTLYILDLVNGKIRRVDTNGIMSTFFTVPGGIAFGRGLWVSDDETVAYVSSGTVVKKWTAAGGVTDFSSPYGQLGNLVVDPWGHVVVTDRNLFRVYRLDSAGNRTVIAGNGGTVGGGDGSLATSTALEEVRGVWFLPNGAYLLATHRSSRVWYVDTAGYIHLLLNGHRSGTYAGDGTWFYNPTELRVSECRAVTVDYEGNILITENDVGYVRKVRFLPFEP